MLFFIFSCLMACSGKPVSASCPVEIVPPRVVVKYGDPISVNCSSSSNQTEGMGWESPQDGIPVKRGVSFLHLQIKSVKEWELQPSCFINTIDGGQCFKPLPVIIYKMADGVSMSLPSQMNPMVEGKHYSMKCDITNVAPAKNLSVHWYKGNEIIKTELIKESKPSPTNVSSYLNMTANRDDNGKRIRCEAKLNLGPSGPDLSLLQSNSHDVIVHYPPTFIKPEKENVTLVAGARKRLNCTATGNPMPSYGWQLSSVMQEKKNQDENQPILTISYPGTYNCTVSNNLGTKTKYFTVIGAERNYTTLAAVIGAFLTLAALLLIGGYFFVTKDGTFSFCKGDYIRGQPTSSGPI